MARRACFGPDADYNNRVGNEALNARGPDAMLRGALRVSFRIATEAQRHRDLNQISNLKFLISVSAVPLWLTLSF